MLRKHFKSYVSSHEDNQIVTGRLLLSMDSIINGPWGWFNKEIVLFDPQIHMELQIVGGRLSDLIAFKLA